MEACHGSYRRQKPPNACIDNALLLKGSMGMVAAEMALQAAARPVYDARGISIEVMGRGRQ